MTLDTMTDLAALDPSEIRPAGSSFDGIPGVLSPSGWTPPDDLSYERWLQIGETFRTMEAGVMWWLGDWWRFGHRKWGEMASQATREAVNQITGYSVKTLQNAARVADRFPTEASRLGGVPWSYHEAVAVLPPVQRIETLQRAVDEDLDRDEVRTVVKQIQQQNRFEAHAQKALPAVDPPDLRLHLADARALPIETASIDLIVTSPPYALEKGYDGDGDLAPGSWLGFIRDALIEMLRVSAPGGRLALNVPLDTTLGGYRPTYAQAVAAAVRVGWTYRTTIVWHDDQLGKSTARGSVDTASAPHLIAPAEMIAVFAAGEWKRDVQDRPSGIDHDDWLAWTNGFWSFPGESSPWEDHPAAYPLELPHRLIYLLSFVGDTVLDPFVGSGTTAVAALTAGRSFVGADTSQTYLDSTRRRVARGWQRPAPEEAR